MMNAFGELRDASWCYAGEIPDDLPAPERRAQVKRLRNRYRAVLLLSSGGEVMDRLHGRGEQHEERSK